MELPRILDHFNGVKRNGGGWSARCPNHDDKRNSLSINESHDGKVLLTCHAGCETEAVLRSVGLEWSDLFPSNGLSTASGKIVAIYNYRDEGQKLLFQVVRFDPKDFRQRKPDGRGGWCWRLGRTRRVLYRLPELLSADPKHPVFIPEGEKDCDKLAELGAVATCNVGGALKWKESDSEVLADRHIVVLPDNDEPGRKHAEQVANALHGKAKSVRVLELFDVPEGGDVSDWLDAGGTLEELFRLAKGVQNHKPTEQKPEEQRLSIILTGDLKTDTDEAWKAIHLANEPPDLFRHGTTPAHRNG